MKVHVPIDAGPSVAPTCVRSPTWFTKSATLFGAPHAVWCMSVIQAREVSSSGMLVCANVWSESSWPLPGLISAYQLAMRV